METSSFNQAPEIIHYLVAAWCVGWGIIGFIYLVSKLISKINDTMFNS